MTFWGIDVQWNLYFPICRGENICVKINRCQILLIAKKQKNGQMRIKNNIWQLIKLIPQVLDKIGSAVLLLALKETLTFWGYTVRTRNAIVQSVIGILDSVWKIKLQVFTSCIGKGFNPVHPYDLLAVANVFGWEFKFCRNIQKSSHEMKYDTF